MRLEDPTLKQTGAEPGDTLPSSGTLPDTASCRDPKACFPQERLRSELLLGSDRKKVL